MKENTIPIGIGKIDAKSFEKDLGIPELHFIVSRASDGVFDVILLEFGLVASRLDIHHALSDLASLVRFHIETVMSKGRGREELIEALSNDGMQDYWAAYRNLESEIARDFRKKSCLSLCV